MIRALMDARRSARVITLAAVLSVGSLALAALPALAADPDPTTTTVPPEDTTTTTVPPEDTTTTTVPPEDTTTTTVPPEDTTTTTVPPEDTTTTTEPGGESSDLSPDETLEPEPAFAYLTNSQRAALLQLQTVNDTLATRHFALVDLDHQLAAAKDELKAVRARENAAAEREIVSLVAALDRNDAGTQAPSELDALWRSFESERNSAKRARVQAQASVAALNALVADQTQAVTDATAARDAAESAVRSALGSDAGLRPGPDGITAALAAAQAGQPDPIALAGFAMPIPGARLGSPFGIRIDPLGGGGGFHPGLDFDASSGTPIHAAAAGVVVMAADCGGYGYCVVIDHGSSLATVYAHQSTLLSQVGDQVDVGQVIGLVGSTGRSTGPHLHFEVRFHGVPIDALPALTA